MTAPRHVRTFVDGAPEKDDAYALAFRMAHVLRRVGLTDRYSMSVHRIPVSRGDEGWGVYLTDRARPGPARRSAVRDPYRPRAPTSGSVTMRPAMFPIRGVAGHLPFSLSVTWRLA